LKNINLKVKDYLDKNRLLLKSFFSLKSIKLLHQRFQESRLLYGKAVFVDIPLVVKILNNINKKYLLNIYNVMGLLRRTEKKIITIINKQNYFYFLNIKDIIIYYF